MRCAITSELCVSWEILSVNHTMCTVNLDVDPSSGTHLKVKWVTGSTCSIDVQQELIRCGCGCGCANVKHECAPHDVLN